ncbi:calcium-dependent phosphotriesterase [Pluteus cervinus]|uniref:Calcium-dependent phosphotriesterase n=1 Tax=Pluteus cervinus TaxID=181527 RepID=A0ACD3AVH6_9AGAR|nr:calcium-dependent phosphotriesterase [Pluteus cervinus]
MENLKEEHRVPKPQVQPETPKPEPTGSTSVQMLVLSVVISLVSYGIFVYGTADSNSIPSQLPPQSVFVNPQSFAVLGQTNSLSVSAFRNSSFTQFFNPTNTEPPFFQIFDPGFLDILGPNPTFNQVASNSTFAFAHEAPVYVPELNEVFFASNDGGPLGMSGLNENSKYGKINLTTVEAALSRTTARGVAVNVPVTELDLPDTIQMPNGGTGPYLSNLLLITSGRGTRPPAIALVNPNSPNNVTILLDNFFGRQFNSLNDIKVHPSGAFFFTDPTYGFLQDFRPPPVLPNQVYRFDPSTGAVRVVATNFDKPNGIAFTQDGKIAYVTDTGAGNGFFPNNQTEPATIFAFDVDPVSQIFLNRRIFAYADTGIPDGIQLDTNGNVYSGCGDGVNVWNPDGVLLGKFFLGSVSSNMIFAGPGRLVINAETKMFVAHIAASGFPSPFP